MKAAPPPDGHMLTARHPSSAVVMNTWQELLGRGELDGAWAAVARDHDRLIRSVIRRLVDDPDLVEELYGVVVAALTFDQFARLRRYSREDPSGASMSTWLVVVVRRLVIDWLRREDGRARQTVPTDLDGWRRAMYVARCLERLAASDTYESVRSDSAAPSTFPAFLRELRALARTHPCPEVRPPRRAALLPLSDDLTVMAVDPAEVVEQSRQLESLLGAEAPDIRLAIQLFVVEEVEAAEVARLVGWPNAKAVYNRVGRALARMRAALARAGVVPGDI